MGRIVSKPVAWPALAFLLLAFGAGPATVSLRAQEPPAQGGGRPGGPGGRGGREAGRDAGPVSPGELQELMDAMVVVQAQRDLQLTDEQFPQFLRRLRGLQAARRRAENQRSRAIMELRQIMQRPNAQPDEAQLRERLKAIDDIETRSAAEVREAAAGVYQMLNVRQQARFRLLEEQIERRKLELLARSRQPPPPR